MTISEKVAYLKGMFDGMELDTEKSKEAKLISTVIEVLEEVGLSIADLEEEVDALDEGLDAVSDDLEDVEDVLFGDDECDDDCCCDDEDDDDDFFEVACPNCEEDLVIDADVLEAGFIQCPNCQQKFSIDFSDEECGCGCCDGDEDEE
jgi:hypothetical protein